MNNCVCSVNVSIFNIEIWIRPSFPFVFVFFYCNLIDESFRIIKSLARLSILDCISFFFVFHNANGAYRKFIGLKFYGKKIPLKVWTAECFTNALVVFFLSYYTHVHVITPWGAFFSMKNDIGLSV